MPSSVPVPADEDSTITRVQGSSRPRQRLALGSTRRRLSFERRIHLWIAAAALPTLALLTVELHRIGFSSAMLLLCIVLSAALWALASSFFFDMIARPLQTLANIVAALREDDYSFRARGARRGDSLGDLALEINALAATLQQQRSSAQDALALADRVMTSMPSPVLAFDARGHLRLLNAAAERVFLLQRETALNRTAETLGLAGLASLGDDSLYSVPGSAHGGAPVVAPTAESQPRWSVRRSSFRLYGVPHTLFVLSDMAAALQEEERVAWQRLIRVLGHEINNSLTPIKSIAGTLRARPLQFAASHTSQDVDDFRRGLSVIEDRADSLNRFLQAYQQLSRLPPPILRPVSLRDLLERTLPLERRLRVQLVAATDLRLQADPDQLQQLLINLIKNGTDAALDRDLRNDDPVVTVICVADQAQLTLQVTDNGPGLLNPQNLFVPFYTTKPEGTGIGLTLCRQIATAHRGTIQLRNRENTRGCLAELILPLLHQT